MGRWRHNEPRRGRLGGGLQTSSIEITWQADAGTTSCDAVLAACGTLDDEGRRGVGVLAAQALLGQGEQRILVACVGRRLGDRKIGILDSKGARGRVDGVPEARCRLARRALVQGGKMEAEDAVCQRPAGGNWCRRGRLRQRRRSRGRAWRRRGDWRCRNVCEAGGGGGELLRGQREWSMHAPAAAGPPSDSDGDGDGKGTALDLPCSQQSRGAVVVLLGTGRGRGRDRGRDRGREADRYIYRHGSGGRRGVGKRL